MSRLRIMILCGRSPRHLYVANALCQAGDVVAIVQEMSTEWRPQKLLRKLRPDHLLRKLWRWVRDRRRYIGNQEAKFFFPQSLPHLECTERLHTVPHINHPRVVALAQTLKPDLICVFGTSLIRDAALLNAGRLGMINLHGGLSPEYRGADCTFWALYNGEPDKVGCTLHYIDAGIDTGRLIAHISPEVHDGDQELELFWRATRDSAAVYAEAIGRLAQGEALGVAQSGKGRLYQVKHRGLRHERALSARLASGLLAGVHLPRRIRWFVGETAQERRA